MPHFLKCVSAVLASGLLLAACQSPPAPDSATGIQPEPPPAQTRRDIMQHKLTLAENILAGVTLEDFEKVRLNAYTLYTLSRESDFQTHPAPGYTSFSSLFRDQAEQLSDAAAGRNMKAMTDHYLSLAQTCILCHQLLRGQAPRP